MKKVTQYRQYTTIRTATKENPITKSNQFSRKENKNPNKKNKTKKNLNEGEGKRKKSKKKYENYKRSYK